MTIEPRIQIEIKIAYIRVIHIQTYNSNSKHKVACRGIDSSGSRVIGESCLGIPVDDGFVDGGDSDIQEKCGEDAYDDERYHATWGSFVFGLAFVTQEVGKWKEVAEFEELE